jgi:RHS repeat-associated protein
VIKVAGLGADDSGVYTVSSSYTDISVNDSQASVSYYLQASDNAGNYTNSGTISVSIPDRTPIVDFSFTQEIIDNDFIVNVTSTEAVSYDVDLYEDGTTIINSSTNIAIANTYSYALTSNKHYHAKVTVRDAVGNYISETATQSLKHNIYAMMDNLNMTYIPNTNQLEAVHDAVGTSEFDNDYDSKTATVQFTYDGNGNMLTDANSGVTYTYNTSNLVETATIDNGDVYTFDYDGAGQLRTEHKNGTLVSRYVYDASGLLVAKLNANNKMTSKPIYANGEQIGKTVYKYDGSGNQTSSNDYYYIKDHLSNIRVVLKDDRANGTTADFLIAAKKNYYPFGLEVTSFSDLAEEDNLNGYQGKEVHEGTGTLDFHVRRYQAALGRFNRPDRYTEKYVGMSSYSAMGNNPISITDFTGDSLEQFTYKFHEDGETFTVYADHTIIKDVHNAFEQIKNALTPDQRKQVKLNESYRSEGEQNRLRDNQMFTIGTRLANNTFGDGKESTVEQMAGKTGNYQFYPTATPGSSNHGGGFGFDFQRRGVSEDVFGTIKDKMELNGLKQLKGDPIHFGKSRSLAQREEDNKLVTNQINRAGGIINVPTYLPMNFPDFSSFDSSLAGAPIFNK